MTPDEGRQGNRSPSPSTRPTPRDRWRREGTTSRRTPGQCGLGRRLRQPQRRPHRVRGPQLRRLAVAPDELARPEQGELRTQYGCTTDPVAYFGQDGKLYYLLMAYQGDPPPPARPARNVCPMGAVNDWGLQPRHPDRRGQQRRRPELPDLHGCPSRARSPSRSMTGLARRVGGRDHPCHVAGGARPRKLLLALHRRRPELQGPLRHRQLGPATDDSGQGSFVDVGPAQQVYADGPVARGMHIRSARTRAQRGAQRRPCLLQRHSGTQMRALSDPRADLPASPPWPRPLPDSPLAELRLLRNRRRLPGPGVEHQVRPHGQPQHLRRGEPRRRQTWGDAVRVNDDVPDGGVAAHDAISLDARHLGEPAASSPPTCSGWTPSQPDATSRTPPAAPRRT